MQYLQLSYLIPKIIFFFLISSVLIGIHISLIEFAYAPNIIIASILLVYLSSNLQNAIFYIVVFSIIYGAISIEKIGWVLLICNIPLFLFMIIESLSLKKDSLIFLILITILSESTYNLLLNINNLSSTTFIDLLTYGQNINLILGNYSLTIILILLIHKLIQKSGIQRYV